MGIPLNAGSCSRARPFDPPWVHCRYCGAVRPASRTLHLPPQALSSAAFLEAGRTTLTPLDSSVFIIIKPPPRCGTSGAAAAAWLLRRPVSEVPAGPTLKYPPDASHAATCELLGFRSSPDIICEYADGGSSWLPLVLHRAQNECVNVSDLRRLVGLQSGCPPSSARSS
jgi:hypothetical protein